MSIKELGISHRWNCARHFATYVDPVVVKTRYFGGEHFPTNIQMPTEPLQFLLERCKHEVMATTWEPAIDISDGQVTEIEAHTEWHFCEEDRDVALQFKLKYG